MGSMGVNGVDGRDGLKGVVFVNYKLLMGVVACSCGWIVMLSKKVHQYRLGMR